MKKQNRKKEDAVFIGWLATPWEEDIALYNIIAPKHRLFGSTVTDETLRKLRLSVPKIFKLKPISKKVLSQ